MAATSQRVKLIAKLDKQFAKEVARLEAAFAKHVQEFFAENLDVVDGKVVNSAKNYAKTNGLQNVAKIFAREEGAKMSRKVAVGFAHLIDLNTDYFAGKTTVAKGLRAKVKKGLLARYGIKVVKGELTLLDGGWVKNLGNIAEPFARVQQIGISAVSQGVPLKTLKRSIALAAVDTGARSIVHHMNTNAKDAYSQFDRKVQEQYADELDLFCFIYEGGLIDTSRQFCDDRNGKVFTRLEAEGWALLEWNGKNKDYEGLRDMGGHNCRHHPSFISNELAIILRPDVEPLINAYLKSKAA